MNKFQGVQTCAELTCVKNTVSWFDFVLGNMTFLPNIYYSTLVS